MKNILKFSLFIVAAVFIFSCSREGTGGNATLVVFLKHHGFTIVNHVGYPDTVYVKFNAKDAPSGGLTKYDTYFVGEVGEDHVHLENLKWGDYYLFGVGKDTTGPYRVLGGMHVKIKRSERKGEKDVDLAVTE
jgi:hypothetical protein